MATIYSFLTSDSAALLQFLLLLGVIAVLIMMCIQTGNRLRRVDRENMQLRRDVGELCDQSDRAYARLQDLLGRQRELLCRIGDHFNDDRPLAHEDFEAVRNARSVAVAPQIRIELVDGDFQDPLVVTESTFEAEEQSWEDPDVSGPVSAVVTHIDNHSTLARQRRQVEEWAGKDPADVLTRALKMSKAN